LQSNRKSLTDQSRSGYHLMETCEGLNPDLSVEIEDNSIGKESRCSWPDYNRLEMLHLSNRYTNSHG
jgi:hypothetical protein